MNASWDNQRIARTALIIAIVFFSVWMFWQFLAALAWAGVLAIATWPLRHAFARHGMGKSSVATLLTLVLALVLVVPLILIGFGVATRRHDHQWVSDVRENGLGTPDLLSSIPYIGTSFAAWWEANLAEPGAAQALFGRTETSGIFSLTRTLGVQVASRLPFWCLPC